MTEQEAQELQHYVQQWKSNGPFERGVKELPSTGINLETPALLALIILIGFIAIKRRKNGKNN